MNKIPVYLKVLVVVVLSFVLSACTATQKENQATFENREKINSAIPIPPIPWSSRRHVLMQYYAQILAKTRLRTCTMVTARGGNGTADGVIAIAETIGMPVNLSNQVTDPANSEPDTVYVGQNDQTVFILRNGFAIVTEADTTAVTGDCPEGLRVNTTLQQVIDYQSKQPEGSGDVNFLAPQK